MSTTILRALISTEINFARQKTIESWGSEFVIVHGTIFHPAELPGFGVFIRDEIVGLLTYNIEHDSCEIVTLNSWLEGEGIGTDLINEVKHVAVQSGCTRLWLVTTNDNTHVLNFYQKRGFVIAGIRINVLESTRRIKPEIPLLGCDGIPLRDEIDLEMFL